MIPPELSVISWNIHRARGGDGVVDPTRIAEVLRSEVWQRGAEALILQEADAEVRPHKGLISPDIVEGITGLKYAHASGSARTTEQSHGALGVVAYLHPGITVEDINVLEMPGVCPRAALVMDIDRGGQRLRMVATHLALSQALRAVQMRLIGQHLQRRGPRPLVLVGDLNEWRPWGGVALSRLVTGIALRGPAKASFPVHRPILPLDRVLVCPAARVCAFEVLGGPGIRAASDHRPIHAKVAFKP